MDKCLFKFSDIDTSGRSLDQRAWDILSEERVPSELRSHVLRVIKVPVEDRTVRLQDHITDQLLEDLRE